MAAEHKARRRRCEPALWLQLTEPKVVPATKQQRDEIVQIFTSLILDWLQQERARARAVQVERSDDE